jgi:Interferon-induced transmembrane protein
MERISTPPQEKTKACPMCGRTILARAQKCEHCHEYLTPLARRAAGQPSVRRVAPPPPDNMPDPMGRAIFATLLFLPLGIVAIVFAAQAHSKANAGDYGGAAQAARTSNAVAYFAYGMGVLCLFGYLLANH